MSWNAPILNEKLKTAILELTVSFGEVLDQDFFEFKGLQERIAEVLLEPDIAERILGRVARNMAGLRD